MEAHAVVKTVPLTLFPDIINQVKKDDWRNRKHARIVVI
jgi:hypothetical protein